MEWYWLLGGADMEARFLDSLSMVIYLGTVIHVDNYANHYVCMLVVSPHGKRICSTCRN